VLRQAATKYHPGNPVTITMCYDNFRVAEARCNAWIDGNSGAGRRCYFGCTSGSHQVSISCRADFQLSYYCWGCNKRGVLMKTPIKAGHVRPRNMATDPIPDDFQNGVIDYNTVPIREDEGETPRFMRKIRPLGNGTYLGGKSTVILHGRMGTGKTVSTKALLDRVRQEKPEASIVAISFRKMLAAMFADSFELDNYTDSKEQSLFDNAGLAIQLESLERLGKPQESSDEGVLKKKFRVNPDVIVLDEIESVLAHLRSSTLKEQLMKVWNLFFNMVSKCTCLVVCDADIGPRSFEFLRMTRKVHGSIPGLQYHINHYIAIRTRFIDYAGVSEWKDALLRILVQDKRVFYFSNNKTHMRTMERFVRETMEEWMKERRAALTAQAAVERPGDKKYVMELINQDELHCLYGKIQTEMLVIDANISESEKRLVFGFCIYYYEVRARY